MTENHGLFADGRKIRVQNDVFAGACAGKCYILCLEIFLTGGKEWTVAGTSVFTSEHTFHTVIHIEQVTDIEPQSLWRHRMSDILKLYSHKSLSECNK